jgi:hypothetical protein
MDMNHRLCLGLLLCLACGAEPDREDREQASQGSITGDGDGPPRGESSASDTSSGSVTTIDPIEASPMGTSGVRPRLVLSRGHGGARRLAIRMSGLPKPLASGITPMTL